MSSESGAYQLDVFSQKYSWEEQLILEVEAHPLLYNKSLDDYKNRNKKADVWQEIATILEVSVERVTKRWKNLKDTFSNKLRTNKLDPSGTGGGVQRKWIFYDKMCFLIPFIQVNKTESNYSTKNSAASDTGNEGRQTEDSVQGESEMDEENEFVSAASKIRRIEENERKHVTNKILKAIDNLQKDDPVPPPPPRSSVRLFYDSLAGKAELLSEYDQSVLEQSCLTAYHKIRFSNNMGFQNDSNYPNNTELQHNLELQDNSECSVEYLDNSD